MVTAPRDARHPGAPPARSWTLVEARQEILRRVEQQLLDVPMLPEVAQEALGMLQDPSCDGRRLSSLIHRDQAIAAHLLRIASSPLYHRGAQLVSLQQAVSRLGTRTIGEIILAVCTKSGTFRVPGFEAEVQRLFRHSYATAFLARQAARIRRSSQEEAFLGGLLHDLGKLAALQCVGQVAAPAAKLDPAALEALLFEVHCEVGAAIAAAWKLPAALSEVMRHHHDPESAPGAKRAAHLTAFADRLAYAMFDEGSADAAALAAHPSAMALNLYPEDVTALIAEREPITRSLEVMP